MREFENIVVGKNAVPALIIAVILMAVIPAVFFLYWRKNHKQQTKISYLVAGAVGFIVSARVLELGVHLVCVVADNPVSRFINGSTAVYVLYGITMAGVFEECGRYIILKYIMKKNRTPENAVLYGIGHGGIEVLALVLPSMILYLVIAVLFSAGNPENALKTLNITEETAAAALPSIQSAAAFDYAMSALHVIERLSAMFAQIGLTVVVYYGIVTGKKICLPAAILAHMLMDIVPGLYQRNAVPLWAVELWGAAGSVALIFIAVKMYRKMKAQSPAESTRCA